MKVFLFVILFVFISLLLFLIQPPLIVSITSRSNLIQLVGLTLTDSFDSLENQGVLQSYCEKPSAVIFVVVFFLLFVTSPLCHILPTLTFLTHSCVG